MKQNTQYQQNDCDLYIRVYLCVVPQQKPLLMQKPYEVVARGGLKRIHASLQNTDQTNHISLLYESQMFGRKSIYAFKSFITFLLTTRNRKGIRLKKKHTKKQTNRY